MDGRHAWLVVLVVAACGRDSVPRPPAPGPVSRADAEDYARRFVAAAMPCVPDRVDALIDNRALWLRAIEAADVPSRVKRSIARELDAVRFGPVLCAQLAASGGEQLTLLRVRERDGRTSALIRSTGRSGAVGYEELLLGRFGPSQQVLVDDVYSFIGGYASQGMADELENNVAGDAAESRADHEIWKRILVARGEGRVEEARRLIAMMSPRRRASKRVRLAEVATSSELPPDEYAAVIDRYRASFPNDPGGDLIALDAYFLRKDVARALDAIDRIDAAVGRDPFLDVYRARVYLLDPTGEHVAFARQRAEQATEALPDMSLAWLTLAEVGVVAGDHAAAAAALAQLDAHTVDVFEPAALAGEAHWDTFLASEPYRRWLATRTQ